jgi:hypothetical protein
MGKEGGHKNKVRVIKLHENRHKSSASSSDEEDVMIRPEPVEKDTENTIEDLDLILQSDKKPSSRRVSSSSSKKEVKKSKSNSSSSASSSSSDADSDSEQSSSSSSSDSDSDTESSSDPESELTDDSTEEDEDKEDSGDEDDDSRVSFDDEDIMNNDALYYILSKFFMTKDGKKNIADILSDILDKLQG